MFESSSSVLYEVPSLGGQAEWNEGLWSSRTHAMGTFNVTISCRLLIRPQPLTQPSFNRERGIPRVAGAVIIRPCTLRNTELIAIRERDDKFGRSKKEFHESEQLGPSTTSRVQTAPLGRAGLNTISISTFTGFGLVVLARFRVAPATLGSGGSQFMKAVISDRVP
ncbi:hypothetical protein CROQUDRAFT_90119 [Cronartium quercuum f. sp. fusiforme G11]|uniref:Uncharacterized protein n=1 Tax=Cronartium quercuum f. sp. fusiforme G11 TaxID=708437 RepID=A0A9P6NM99_9BASI|nr:hypothetical protein CROQUDRAFT_90119 [Cronartium quercuum f. sp. fusiforme G11]